MIKVSEFPLLDHVATGIFAIERDGTVGLWNKVLESWSGLSRTAIEGQNLFNCFPHLDAPVFRQQMQAFFESHEALIFDAESKDEIIPCPLSDGSHRHLKVTVSYLAKHELAVFTLEDKTEQHELIDNYRDIAEKLQYELEHATELEKEKQVLLSAIDQALEAVIICNRDGMIEYANHTFHEQTGWSREDTELLRLPDDLFIDERDGLQQQLQQVFNAGEAWQGRQQSKRKNGQDFPSSISIAPITDIDNQVHHAVIIQEDITRQNAMDEKLRRTQKQEALITLVGGIAHDFNNLLAGLVGQMYLISREVRDMEKTSERVRKSRNIIEEASEIVRQLLTFARQGEHAASEFPLDSFIKEFHKLAMHNVPESISMSLDYKPGNYSFRGDAGQLQQSLLNIIQNAAEACQESEQGEISLTLSGFSSEQENRMVQRHPVLRHGNFAHIAVRDNGAGISPENLERIFDPFFTTKQLGSGLGLAIALGCVRSHHGILDVESKPGEGTTVHLYLPIRLPRESGTRKPDSFVNVQANILLVDDDPNVLEPTTELLESMGHHVEKAVDGLEALSTFNADSDKWDIIITDMVMPRLGGLDAARQIRDVRADIPVIFATGYDQSLVIDQTRKMENSVLISKPFNPEDLDHMIVEMVTRNRKTRTSPT